MYVGLKGVQIYFKIALNFVALKQNRVLVLASKAKGANKNKIKNFNILLIVLALLCGI